MALGVLSLLSIWIYDKSLIKPFCHEDIIIIIMIIILYFYREIQSAINKAAIKRSPV